jgi:hypothetical protein
LATPFDDLELMLNHDPDLLTEESLANLVHYMNDIPLELLTKVVKRLGSIQFRFKKELLNNEKLIKRFLNS